MGGSCSATTYACDVGYYCQELSGTARSCLACSISQPKGILCFCGADSKVENCAECTANACSKCANSFYLSEQNCIPCPANCNICDAKTCTACRDGFYLENGSCKACEGCLTCSSKTACLTCAQGSFLSISGSCELCSESCTFCQQAELCEECAIGHYLASDKCEICREGQPAGAKCNCGDYARANCISCDNNACTACNTGFSLVGPYCYLDECNSDKNCNSGQFCDTRPGSLKKCKLCAESCKSCSVSSTKCTACGENSYLRGESCEVCSPGQVQGAECVCGATVVENCVSCVEGVCVECLAGKDFVNGNCQNQKEQKNVIIGVSVGVCIGVVLIVCAVVGGLYARKIRNVRKAKKLTDNGVLVSKNESNQQMVF